MTKNKEVKQNYFDELFNSLAQRDERTGEFCIIMDGDELYSPNDLKNYFIKIITSNVQYDLGIDYDESDVYKMAQALTNEK